MNPIIKKLGSQTAIYGLSSIAGRFLSYLLLPIHTFIFKDDPAQYGVVTEFYAYVAFLNIVFTYGMETAYFRFTSLPENLSAGQAARKKIYDTALASLLLTSLALAFLLIAFSQPIANLMGYPDHADYIVWFALILALDAIVAVPFSRLRQENRPLLFAALKVINIVTNVGFNIFFLIGCPFILSNQEFSSLHPFINGIYHPDYLVGYIFLSTLIASIITFAIFLPKYIVTLKWQVDGLVWRKMLLYAWPLIIVGLAGMVNETLSRAMLKYLLPVDAHEAQRQLGIFGACYKMSIFMTAFVQAYRMAAEPFFFYESSQKNPQLIYAKAMNYFVIIGCLIFLFAMLYMDLFKRLFIRSEEFWEGIRIVPVLLLANFFLGIYYNLTIWYKLTNKNLFGAAIAIMGAVITIVLNVWWIPIWGYIGSSWVTFITYGSMMLVSFFLGQKFYPVPYDLRRFFSYLSITVAIFFLSNKIAAVIPEKLTMMNYLISTVLLITFAGLAYLFETGKIAVFKPIK